MTTIAYRDGVMVGDRRAYSGGRAAMGEKSKIHVLRDGSLFGASSSKVGACEKARRLVEEHGVEATLPAVQEVQALVVRPDGKVFYLNDGDSFSGPLSGAFFAIGSGEQFAIGAMAAGASALEAVKIASECEPWTGAGVDVLVMVPEASV